MMKWPKHSRSGVGHCKRYWQATPLPTTCNAASLITWCGFPLAPDRTIWPHGIRGVGQIDNVSVGSALLSERVVFMAMTQGKFRMKSKIAGLISQWCAQAARALARLARKCERKLRRKLEPTECYKKGDRLWDEAQYSRNELLPKFLWDQRWNIAVSSCALSAELAIKSVYYSSGEEPERTHNTKRLLDRMLELCNKGKLSFSGGLVQSNGDGYIVILQGERISLLVRVGGTYTELCSASNTTADFLNEVELEIKNVDQDVTVILNGVVALHASDAAITDSEPAYAVTKPAENERFRTLKKVANPLVRMRPTAIYHEKSYEKEDVEEERDNLDAILGLLQPYRIP